MNARSPCLAEQWFVEDAIRDIQGLCPMCRTEFETRWLRLFGPTNEQALSNIYRQSRAIRVGAVMDNRLGHAARTDNWSALGLLQTIDAMIRMSADVLMQQRATA